MSLAILVAPSPPEDIRVVLVTAVTLQVTWETLIPSSGVVALYTVYASPFVSTASGRSRRQADESSLGILSEVFFLCTC